MKIINKGDIDNDGSGSNDDNVVKDYGDNYDDSCSNHHEIYDDKDDTDDDNSDNDQIMNECSNYSTYRWGRFLDLNIF